MKYILSHKTKPVLSMELDESTGTISGIHELFAPERLPVGISFTGNAVDRRAINEWWMGRSIPASRSGLRDALEALQMSTPLLLLTKCCGLSLSDQYWVCPEGSGLHWEDINFFDHPFSSDVGNILFGHVNNTSFRFVDILDFKESYYGTRVVLWGLDYAFVSNHGF